MISKVFRLFFYKSRLTSFELARYTSMDFQNKDLFTDKKQVELYAKCRPNYSNEIFERIREFCNETTNSFDIALDLGCGSGQSTVPLTKFFKKVIGFDVSEQQISKAPTNVCNLSFYVSQAEHLSQIGDCSIDLVTIAQSFHWVNRDQFFREVDRVLKPSGSLIMYGYGMWTITHPEINKYLHHVYGDILGEYWPKERQMVEDKYSSVVLPYPGWIRDDSLSIDKDVTMQDLVGYMGSWSAYHKYNTAHPDNNLMAQVIQRLQEFSTENDTTVLEPKTTITWPVFMLMGHKPY